MRTAKTLVRLGGCPGWSESSVGACATLLVLSCCGSFGFCTVINNDEKNVDHYIAHYFLFLEFAPHCSIYFACRVKWRHMKEVTIPTTKNKISARVPSVPREGILEVTKALPSAMMRWQADYLPFTLTGQQKHYGACVWRAKATVCTD